MSYMKVSASGMSKDEEAIVAQSKGIPDFLQELSESMSLLASCWEGPAWEEFQRQVRYDIQNMSDVYNWLTTYVEVLSKSRESYQKTEEKCCHTIEDIRI